MIRRYITLAALLIGPFIGIDRAPADGVQITPSSGTIDVPPYAQSQTQVFSVKNTGDRTVDFSIQAADCQPFELNCSWSTFSLNGVAPNQSVPLTVTFTSGAPGWSGTIAFVAKVNDNQSVAAGATITVRVPQQAWVETKSLNPGTTIGRDHCVAFTVATNAAYECGDLRIAHAAPSLRVRNDDRTPMLLYNSAHAEPRPVVLGEVSTPSAGSVTNVTATLTVRRGASDVRVDSQLVGALPAASTRRIALSYDASGDTTGIYPYTMTVWMTVDGQPQPPISTSDTLVVVNRKNSPFGAGWWLAGYERLVPLSGGSFLWVGGDGSTRCYTPDPVTPGAFGALGLDRPDSLVLEGSTYVRKLRHRARVEFDLTGRHVVTRDPLGIATTFEYDGAGRLQSILHPTSSQPRHRFYYNAGGLLDSLTGPGPVSGTRRITLLHGSGGRVERITDADSVPVTFGFGSPTALVVTSRTNRNGVTQTFGFASNRLVQATVPLNATESAVSTFCPAEIRGLMSGGCGGAPLLPSDAVTTVDGPRPASDVNDLTTIKVDRFGEPEIVTDAFGRSVRLYRGNRSTPGLPTRVLDKKGRANDAYYYANGLVAAVVDYGPLGPNRDAVTSYQWDTKWERITQITYPEQNFVRFGYDTATGNRIWQEDGRGVPSRVTFAYNDTTGNGPLLVASVTYPPDPQGAQARDTVKYDAMANVTEQRTAVGSTAEEVTRLTNDAAGRTILMARDITAGGSQQQRDSIEFDAIDRVLRTKSYGFGTSPAETLFTQHMYDNEGNRRRLERWSTPDVPGTPIGHIVTRWVYDLGNRVVADTAPDGKVEKRAYDAAGNVRTDSTRRGLRIEMTYDVLNRLTTRALPQVTYPRRSDGVVNLGNFTGTPENRRYPRYPLSPADTGTIASDLETFEYDELGQLTVANNADAKVRRTYFPNGLVASEVSRIRTYAGPDTTTHTYQLGYAYDLNGRRTQVTHPPQLATGTTTGATTYQYSLATGALERVTDPLGNPFTYHLDLRGQVDTLSMPGGISEAFAFDAAGRLAVDRVNNASMSPSKFTINPLRLTAFTYDARGKVLSSQNQAGALDALTALYTGLGYVKQSDYADHGTNQVGNGVGYTSHETFQFDALGNLFGTNTTTTGSTIGFSQRYENPRGLRYQAAAGRVRADTTPTRADTIMYDGAGNTEFSTFAAVISGSTVEDRASYYDANERLRAVDHRLAQSGNAPKFARNVKLTFEEFRYDALGRRVLVRTRRWCQGDADPSGDPECGLQTIRRTVWDGDRELYEVQMPGGDTTPTTTLESDTEAPEQPADSTYTYFDRNPFFGRVAYTNGLGIDQPLGITRLGYSDRPLNRPFVRWPAFTLAPHWNARGQVDNGTFADGGAQKCMNDGVNASRCVYVQWPFGWTAYNQKAYTRTTWHGSLVEQKRDGSGMLYRRNRYVDPATGRFTQEDPIGLAGGMNLYGFAGGDPVNYSDPFGLCPNPLATGLGSLQCAIEDIIGAIKSGPSQIAAFWSDPLKGGFAVKLAMVPLTVVDGAGEVEGIANAIGKGHAFAKHVLQTGKGGGEFAGLGIRTVKQFQTFVRGIMESASGAEARTLSRGRTAFWDDATGTVVIHDPRSPDLGTAFRPKDGRAFFEGLK